MPRHPRSLVLLMAAVMAMGFSMLAAASDHVVALDTVPMALANNPAAAPATGGDPVAGGALYIQSCSACHGWLGDGNGRVRLRGVEMPDLRDRLTMTSHSASETYLIIKDGGEAHGLCDKMIPAGRRLSEDDLRDLTAYVLALPAYEYIRQVRSR